MAVAKEERASIEAATIVFDRIDWELLCDRATGAKARAARARQLPVIIPRWRWVIFIELNRTKTIAVAVSDLDDGGNNDCVFTIAIVFTISSLSRRERLLSQNQNGLKLWHGNVRRQYF